MLNAEQIDAFKADGHLILPGFVDAALVAQWRDQFWSHLGCTLDDPDQWPDKVEGFKPEPIFGDLPQLQAIAAQVGGGRFSGGGCGVAVRWPKSAETWAMPASGQRTMFASTCSRVTVDASISAVIPCTRVT